MLEGDRLGGYRLGRQLGTESGQGKVFEAFDRDGSAFALKVPLEHAERVRFARELDAARAVQSAFVARVYDYDLTSEPPFIVYAKAPGRTLAEQPNLPLPVLLRVFWQTARGLADVHKVRSELIPQLAHGDISPDNIVATEIGESSLIDLGASVTGRAGTVSRAAFGKEAYAAPEQFDGAQPTPASDVWQLGVTIAQVLTGRMPFGRGLDLADRVRYGQPNLEGLPVPIAGVLLAALHKDPEQRLLAESLSDWLRRLELAQARRAAPARPVRAGDEDPWSMRLVQVQQVQYWPDDEGRIQIRALVAAAADGGRSYYPLLPPRPRVGDLVSLRPDQRRHRLFEREYTVYFPADAEPEPPVHICNCRSGLLPLRGNWRDRTQRDGEQADERLDEYRSFCPNAGGCLRQDQAWWCRLLALYMPQEVVEALLSISVFTDPGRVGLLGDATVLKSIYPEKLGLADRAGKATLRFARAADNDISTFLDACGMPGSGLQGEAGKALRGGSPGLHELLRRDSPWQDAEPQGKALDWWEDRSWRVRPIAEVLARLVEEHGPGDGTERLRVPEGTWWLTTGYGWPA